MRQIRRLRWLFWFVAAINVGMGIATIAYTDASTMTKGALVIYMALSALMLGAYPSLVTSAYELGVYAGEDSVAVDAMRVLRDAQALLVEERRKHEDGTFN